MKLKTLIELVRNGQFSLVLSFRKPIIEFYRVCFVHAGLSNGTMEKLVDGPVSVETLSKQLGDVANRDGLEAWLDLGVSLKELELGPRGYSIKGKLSKKLIEPENDPYRAVFEEITVHHYKHILQTVQVLRENGKFEFDDSIGELVARSSRISEPYIREIMEDIIPRTQPYSLLEVGCGSGAYIRYACELNGSLTVTGLEMQEEVADFARKNINEWGIKDRVKIEVCDVRDFKTDERFDLVTLHQNIYYFKLDERQNLIDKLNEFIRPGGSLLITSACKGGSPFVQMLDVWVSATEGLAPLPDQEELKEQLVNAEFPEVLIRKPIPGEAFYGFIAKKKK